ncbi:MAG: ATP-binding protein [Patescibacteria group bacterium]
MNSIRTKITNAFLVTVVTTSVLIVGIVLVNVVLTNKYKAINENIFYEQSLKEDISFLVDDIYKGFNGDDYTAYQNREQKIKEVVAVLDTKIGDTTSTPDTKVAYRSLKNSLTSFFTYIDTSRENLKENGSIDGISIVFKEASTRLEFVLQNSTTLILSEFKNIANTTQKIQKIQKITIIVIFIIVTIIAITLVVFAVVFSRKISDPLVELSTVARKISEGDLNLDLSPQILKGKDEIGSLARSFSAMLANLREKIHEVQKQIEESAKANIDLNKSKSAILNLLEDIDEEKKKVEETVVIRTKELSAEKARLLASINSLSFGFIIADMEDRIILKNKAMTDLFGFAEGDTVTIDNVSSLLGEHFDLKMQIEQCFKDKAACELKEIVFGTKFLRGIIAPVIGDEAGGSIGYVFLLEDITEAKVIERSREEFFAVASHELRTPLTAIRGNMSTFKEYGSTMDEKEKQEIITDTYDASIRLIGIVNDFLDTSRLEQGKTTFKKEPVDLVPLIRETIKDLDTLAKAKSLTLSFTEPTEAIPLAMVDHDRIKQAISNFIDNAIKYTEKGSIVVTIEKVEKAVAVSVTDTGKGISPQNQSLLFRKFQQAGEEMLARDVSKSTGLGLYITKLVVEAMGGTVELAKSALGEGSTFRLTVPTVL